MPRTRAAACLSPPMLLQGLEQDPLLRPPQAEVAPARAALIDSAESQELRFTARVDHPIVVGHDECVAASIHREPLHLLDDQALWRLEIRDQVPHQPLLNEWERTTLGLWLEPRDRELVDPLDAGVAARLVVTFHDGEGLLIERDQLRQSDPTSVRRGRCFDRVVE